MEAENRGVYANMHFAISTQQNPKSSTGKNRDDELESLGIVVIGRNEGQRLVRCLESISPQCEKIVYVDSGSTDNSLKAASSFGVLTIPLDENQPFTAARARNEGFQRLIASFPEIEFVQFVDGDCEIQSDWLAVGIRFLRSNKDVAIVTGHLEEKHPEQSIYNMMCDIEWETPVGEANSCGGIMIIRRSAFAEVSGFRDELIAGEEPDLCIRMRNRHWRIWHLDYRMATHDAEILRFSEWWKRMIRGGYASAQSIFLYGNSQGRHQIRDSISVTAWAVLIPLIISIAAIAISPWCLILLAAYPIQLFRITKTINRSLHEKTYYAVFTLVAKFAGFQGLLRFAYDKIKNQPSTIIEYKATK